MVDEVWLNGGFRPAGAAIDTSDRGLLLADGVFDTALCLGGTIFRAEAHCERLAASATALGIPVDRAGLQDAMAALAARRIDGSIRLTVTRGPGPRGLALAADPRPTILGTFAPLRPEAMFRPLQLGVASIRRNETSPTARLKTLSYLDAVIANRDVAARGADEALFLNTAGRIACSALGNLFVFRGDRLSTPPLADGVLDGIVRRWVLENAAGSGLVAQECPLTLADLDGSFLVSTNSLRLIAPAYLPTRETPQPERPDRNGDTVDPRLRDLMERLCEAISGECGVDPRERKARLPD